MKRATNEPVGAIKDRLRAACVGHPHASIPWPHRLLHDAIAEIERLETLTAKRAE
jgi:hypothetical protein